LPAKAVLPHPTCSAWWDVAAAGRRLACAVEALLRLGFLLLFCQEKSKRKKEVSRMKVTIEIVTCHWTESSQIRPYRKCPVRHRPPSQIRKTKEEIATASFLSFAMTLLFVLTSLRGLTI